MNEILRHRRYCMKKKAPQYEFFDYLEHTGHGEYIKLPYQPSNKTYLKFRYSVPTNTAECILFGSRSSNRLLSLYWYQNTNSGGSILTKSSNNTYVPRNFGNTVLYDWYEVDPVSSTEWIRKIPGTSTTDQTRTWDPQGFTIPFNLYLFAINHNDAPIGTSSYSSPVNQVAGVKISAIEIYEDMDLVMELKPARRDDGRTGYYDALDDAFHFSENEFDFNVGNFADEYDYYDYLESTVSSGYNGQQYIRTGINAGSNVKMKIKGQLTQGTRFFIFGSRDANNVNQFLCRLGSLKSGTTQTTFGYASISTVYSFGLADTNSIYTIETFPDHWTRTDNDGNMVSVNIPETTFQGNSNITLFALNNNNTYASNLRDYGRVGECQMWVNNILQRDYKPAVRKTDGKTGMFDRANSILYQSWTGVAFNYGNFN